MGVFLFRPHKLLLTRFADETTVPARRPRDGRVRSITFAADGDAIIPGRPGKAAVNVTPRVLLIDGSSETETVLRAVLEPRGTSVSRTRSHAAQRVQTPQADVVVLDLDEPQDGAEIAWTATGRVLLGSAHFVPNDPTVRFLEKPFQYPELIRAVEDLLARAPAA